MRGKLVDVHDKHGRVVLKVGSTVTSIVVWVQNGEPVPAEKRNTDFGSKGYQG